MILFIVGVGRRLSSGGFCSGARGCCVGNGESYRGGVAPGSEVSACGTRVEHQAFLPSRWPRSDTNGGAIVRSLLFGDSDTN